MRTASTIFFGLLTAVAVLAGSATVNWDPPAQSATVASYQILLGPTNQANYTVTNSVAGGASSSTVFTNLAGGVTYKCVAVAVGTNGIASDPSNQLIFTMTPGPLNLRLSLQSTPVLGPESWIEDTNFVAVILPADDARYYRTVLAWVQ